MEYRFIWLINEVAKITLEAFEMCYWRKVEKIRWTEMVSNEGVPNPSRRNNIYNECYNETTVENI